MDKPTCGVLYEQSVNEFQGHPLAFAAGHVNGQAEKVYLGACRAAMFRPQPECFDQILTIVKAIANRYGLLVYVLPYEPALWDSRKREIWISRESESRLAEWLAHPVDSAEWHFLRGRACGIPADEIDHSFHERRGYNQPCDGAPAH